MNRDGVLNGAAPWKAEHRYVDIADAAARENVHWVVSDDEGSISAVVLGGEEMAEFLADKLNALAQQEGE